MELGTMTKPRKPITGWHMLAGFAAFFGVIIAVNFYMASLARSTFGGVVVENSYVAGQHYNEWLDKAEAQEKLGWTETVTLDKGRHVLVQLAKDGTPLSGIAATGEASHPLGRKPAIALTFHTFDTGVVRSEETLPAGRWQVALSVRHNADIARYKQEVK